MKRNNSFRKFSHAICLCAVALLAVSCSEEPAPGPISPINSGNTRRLRDSSAATGEVRPVKMLEARHALAKSTSANPQAIQHLQDLSDELQYIVDSKLGTSVAKTLTNVVAKVKAAKDALNKISPDNKAALGNLAGAEDDLQAAIKGKLLNSTPGNQFIAEITAIESLIQAGVKTHDCRGTSKLLWMTKAEGGLIAHCGHRIIVPPNALKTDSQMSIALNPTSYITVDFGPDGWFNSAVAVGISYQNADLTGLDISALLLAWFDALIGKWLNLGGSVDTVNKIVWVKTYHFTQYTISTK